MEKEIKLAKDKVDLLIKMIGECKPCSTQRCSFFYFGETHHIIKTTKILNYLWDLGLVINEGEFGNNKWRITDKAMKFIGGQPKRLPELKIE